MLQIRNCLSIWRTTGLGRVEPSLAILKLWHASPSSSSPATCRATQRQSEDGAKRSKRTQRWPRRREEEICGWWRSRVETSKEKYLLPSRKRNYANRLINQQLQLLKHKPWSVKIRNIDRQHILNQTVNKAEELCRPSFIIQAKKQSRFLHVTSHHWLCSPAELRTIQPRTQIHSWLSSMRTCDLMLPHIIEWISIGISVFSSKAASRHAPNSGCSSRI